MRRRTSIAIGTASCLALACPAPASAQIFATPTPTSGPPLDSPPVIMPDGPAQETTHDAGADPTRRGWVDDGGLRPPLRSLWRVDFKRAIGAPVVGGGRVYVTQADAIVALDLRTGRRLWRTPASEFSLAYADGVLVATGLGLAGFDAATGRQLWRADGDRFGSPPLIAGDLVVVQDQGLFAFDLKTGVARWQGGTDDGTDGAPSVSGDRIYQQAACTVVAADRRDGRILWSRNRGCTGGGGGQTMLYRDRVYTEDDAFPVLAAADGSDVDGPSVDLITGDVGVSFRNPLIGDLPLVGFDLPSGKRLWSRPLGGRTFGAPLAIGSDLFRVDFDGPLQVLDARTGTIDWSAALRAARAATDDNQLSDTAAGGGVLVVGRGNTIDALVSAKRRATRVPINLAQSPFVALGEEVGVRGRFRGDLFPALRLQQDAFPYGRFHAAGPPELPRPGGHFALETRPELNTRLRLVSPGSPSRSRTVRVFVFPKVRYRIRNRDNTVTATVAITAAPSLRLRKRTAVLYIARVKSRKLIRLGVDTISGPRREVGGAQFRFPALTDVGRRDYFYTCVPGLHRLGQGTANSAQVRCGDRSIDF